MGLMCEFDFDECCQVCKVWIGDEWFEVEVEVEFFLWWVCEVGYVGGQLDEDDGYQDNVGMDDLVLEILIDESGVCLLVECGGELFVDKCLRVVYGNEIGVGYGFDEVELVCCDLFDGFFDEEC